MSRRATGEAGKAMSSARDYLRTAIGEIDKARECAGDPQRQELEGALEGLRELERGMNNGARLAPQESPGGPSTPGGPTLDLPDLGPPGDAARLHGGRGAVVWTDGRPERVGVDALAAPAPGPGDVVVRLLAYAMSGVHLALVTGATGQLSSDGAGRLEGMGAAGTVIATGEDVTRFALGDDVFGQLRVPGSARTPYALTDAGGPQVEVRPQGLDPAAAAALAEGGLTAKTIIRAARVRPGQKALVVGATGGVGMVLVPLLVEAGVSVVATARTGDEEYVRSLGAAETIDGGAVDASEALARHPDVDLLVDLVSYGEPYFAAARAVPCCGWLVGTLPGETGARPPQPRIGRIPPRAEPGDLAELARGALDGRQPVEIADVHPLVRIVTVSPRGAGGAAFPERPGARADRQGGRTAA